jgi:uncharacterized protein YjbI with pentapeptide repeats
MLRIINEWMDGRPIFPILDKLGKLSIVVAVISFALSYEGQKAEARKAKHYQAWQVINSAAGLPGDGGRSDALFDLNSDRVLLNGLNIENAWLNGLQLEGACMSRSILQNVMINAATLKNSSLEGATLDKARIRDSIMDGVWFRGTKARNAIFNRGSMNRAIFNLAQFQNAVFDRVDITNSLLEQSDFSGAEFQRSVLKSVSFRGSNLERANLRDADIEGADLRNVKGITCDTLKEAKNWEMAYRDPKLACGREIPEVDYGIRSSRHIDPKTSPCHLLNEKLNPTNK